MQLLYQCIDYLSTTAHRNALCLKFTSLQNHNAVVCAETEIWALQLTTTQLQWTMNAAYRCVHSLLQRSCITDVLITYLLQRNPTHCTQVHFLAVPQCSSRRRDRNMSTATCHNTAAVNYECSVSPYPWPPISLILLAIWINHFNIFWYFVLVSQNWSHIIVSKWKSMIKLSERLTRQQ